MMVVYCIEEKQDARSTSDAFFSAFLPVTIILTKKKNSWKGSSDACFV